MNQTIFNKYTFERNSDQVEACIDASKRGRRILDNKDEPSKDKEVLQQQFNDLMHYKCYADITKNNFKSENLEEFDNKTIYDNACSDNGRVNSEEFSFIVSKFLYHLADEKSVDAQEIMNTSFSNVTRDWRECRLLSTK